MGARVLAGRYRLESVVGRGGMGTVWRARDETLDREVAVKEVVLPSGLNDDERDNRHRRTLREARASARLNHPGVVTVHDVVDEDGRPWIVMELVRARSLQEIVDEDGPLPSGRVAAIGRQIAGALRAAHATGILHRDVKPANVLVAEDDRALLTDFGIAQLAGDATLTGTGLILGSPAYMSPERVNGDPAIPASDLWALGATLYAATEGRAPHHRSDAMAVLAAVMTQDVPPPENAGPLAPVITALLERDPSRRLGGDRAEEALKAIASGHAPDLATAPPSTWPSGTGPSGTGPVGAGATQAAPYPHSPQPSPGGPVPPPAPGMTSHYPPGTDGHWTPGDARAATSGAGNRSVAAPILAGVAVAAVILAAAGFFLWPDGSSGGGTGTQQPPPAAGPSTPAGQDTPTTPTTTSTPATSETPGRTPLPDGLVRASGPGYSIGIPRGWERSVQGASVIWTDPASSAYIQVDQTPWSGDPYEHWLEWEQQAIADGQLKNFNRISLTRTSVGGVPAADIEFTWSRDGVTRARDRGVIVNGRPYAVVVAVPASQWNANEALVKNVLDTFRPSGVG
ncbi:serine/threonine-protein kinase [Actinomadura sp. KC345]|uniref:serine/threonine-protein kinase n=1 Tax=Actinomadura sp. KC345 TaxID=2530371 RepID=UPI001A9E2C3B|nr:serine/threonine-protein kinase [Actinomadura sp. KC345]